MHKPAPRIALIHATPLAVAPIVDAFRRGWPEARCMNLLDDSLSVDRAAAGRLTPEMERRFIDLAGYAQRTGCEGILFTCSAFGPAIDAAGRAVAVPTLKPNEAMFAQALDSAPGGRLALVATFEASLASMSAELLAMAAARGRRTELQTLHVPGAMQDLSEGRAEAHDARIAEAVASLQGCEAIMLAQFSMARAQPAAQRVSACPVLSSPDCAVQAMKDRMNHA